MGCHGGGGWFSSPPPAGHRGSSTWCSLCYRQAPGNKQFFQKVFTCAVLRQVPLGKASHRTKHRLSVEGYCRKHGDRERKNSRLILQTTTAPLGKGSKKKKKKNPFSAAHGFHGPGQPPDSSPWKRGLRPRDFPGPFRAMTQPLARAGGGTLGPDSCSEPHLGQGQGLTGRASWQGGRCSEPQLPSPVSSPRREDQGSVSVHPRRLASIGPSPCGLAGLGWL